MRVGAHIPGFGVDSDAPGLALGLVREPVGDAVEFFYRLGGGPGLGLARLGWRILGKAAALAGRAPLASTRASRIGRMRPWHCVIVPLAPFLQPKTGCMQGHLGVCVC